MSQITSQFRVREDFCIEQKPSNCGIVIFGASGDLTHRKLIPALFKLYIRDLLPKHFYLLGVARTEMTDDAFRDTLKSKLSDCCKTSDQVTCFLSQCFYLSGQYDGDELYRQLSERLTTLDETFSSERNHMFYLATPPDLYSVIPKQLHASGIVKTETFHLVPQSPWSRIIIEKPFGHDRDSARELDTHLHQVLSEHQIYRIDHYLGKETVQNILLFRFANSIFEPIWNRRYIDNIQITVAESIGIEHRAGYFETAGLLRDMFQNHLFQMLSLVTMEPPISFDHGVRDEKVKLLRSVRPFDFRKMNEWLVRGQYSAVEGTHGYRDEADVAKDSQTETYVAMKLWVDNWRWQGIPIYLRSGKRLKRKLSEVAVTFKRVPYSMFKPLGPDELSPNVLVFNVQPEEGIQLSIKAKHPGPKLCMTTLTMDFLYRDVYGIDPPDAYERLLLDCMLGDQNLFIRSDAMDTSWTLIDPILERWADTPETNPLVAYPAGSWGPKESETLLGREGHSWNSLD